LSFDIGVQSLDYLDKHYQTDPNATFEFRIDNTAVKSFTAAELFALGENELHHFDVVFDTGAAGSPHTLELVHTSTESGFTGFAVDSIQINDWIV
jgi:hypothetical protein